MLVHASAAGVKPQPRSPLDRLKGGSRARPAADQRHFGEAPSSVIAGNNTHRNCKRDGAEITVLTALPKSGFTLTGNRNRSSIFAFVAFSDGKPDSNFPEML
jgi:hypothetical protein